MTSNYEGSWRCYFVESITGFLDVVRISPTTVIRMTNNETNEVPVSKNKISPPQKEEIGYLKQQ